MTARLVVVLRCDVCPATFIASTDAVDAARAEARRSGWSTGRAVLGDASPVARDVCVGCRF